jgi:class 3 adenylate cyclase
VTVLFADLKGSMELLADRDPEEARKLLDPVLQRMMEAVHRYEGTVNQVMGDGIMALFGAPLAHEDHAERACYAALRMQETVKRYAEDVRQDQGITVGIRVGLNSGEVVVRSIGSDLRMDYTALGQTTHLAARMEQLATPGTTLLSSDTLALAEGYIEVRSIGPTPVKGLAQPIEVYEIVGASAIRSRFQAAAARGLTTFVGRTAEMEQLSQGSTTREPGVGSSSPWSASPAWESLACTTSSATRIACRTAWSSRRLRLVRQGHRVPPRDRAVEGYFGSRAGRCPDNPGKVTGRLLSLDRALEQFMRRVPVAARRVDGRSAVGAPRPRSGVSRPSTA